MAISVSLNGEVFEQVIYSKEDDFEQLVAKNAGTIFGDKAIYIDAKRKINTSSLGGTIPDGFLIDLSDTDDPQFYIVEVELQEHSFDGHILPQINRIITSCKDSRHRHGLIDTLFLLSGVKERIGNLVGSKEVFKFLKDTIDSNQNILIIIDGPKPEFKEQMDTHTEWGRMVKVQIVNHFRRDNNDVLTVEPPFQNISFQDAVSPHPENDSAKPSQYTEEFHLQNQQPQVVEIYQKLKQEFTNAKSALRFAPTKWYIGILGRKRFAYILVYKKKIHLKVVMPEDEVKELLRSGNHKVVSQSQSMQRYWGGNNPTCGVDIYNTNHWDEIQKLVTRLVEKHQEINL